MGGVGRVRGDGVWMGLGGGVPGVVESPAGWPSVRQLCVCIWVERLYALQELGITASFMLPLRWISVQLWVAFPCKTKLHTLLV